MGSAVQSNPRMIFELGIRLLLLLIFVITENMDPFIRKIHPDELWLYKNPKSESYVPVWFLWLMVFTLPPAVIMLFSIGAKDNADTRQALLCYTLIEGLNGVITNFIKLAVGRPRPDYFYRCFPNGEGNLDMECTGNYETIMEGRKSFPSGHSSFSFSCLGFIALYLAGKLHVYGSQGRGETWRMCLAASPLICALMIALSRTCDYHHHWQDVLVGSLLGFFIAYSCYHQFYPSLIRTNSHRPLICLMQDSVRADFMMDKMGTPFKVPKSPIPRSTGLEEIKVVDNL